jgi:hypothetical protein
MVLTWKPEIQYVRSDEVLWVGIFSESIVNCVSLQVIREMADREIAKVSENYTEHQIAGEISKKIISGLSSQGIVEEMSAIVIFVNLIRDFERVYSS